jgi:hypothetical protein
MPTGDKDILLSKAKKIINELAEEHKGGWIPCSERLPEDRQRCLTTARIYVVPDHVDEPDNYIGVELNTYSKKYGWLENPEVIAWQPLPEPYKAEEAQWKQAMMNTFLAGK